MVGGSRGWSVGPNVYRVGPSGVSAQVGEPALEKEKEKEKQQEKKTHFTDFSLYI